MKLNTYLKIAVVASSIALASCAKHLGKADGTSNLSDSDLAAQGLGDNTSFAGQEAGESFTTKAPHNQVYLFEYDEAAFKPKYLPSLNAQIAFLKSHPNSKILIAGHTDERGSREYNVALGERRAATVVDLLRMSGVNESQIRSVSYGKERMVCFGHEDSCHRQNRRAEFIYEETR